MATTDFRLVGSLQEVARDFNARAAADCAAAARQRSPYERRRLEGQAAVWSEAAAIIATVVIDQPLRKEDGR